jgi:hypothetical protein
MAKWIAGAIKRKGALKKAAKAAGKSTVAFAKSVLARARGPRGGKRSRLWHQAHLFVNVLRKLPKPSRAARVRGGKKAARTRARRRR